MADVATAVPETTPTASAPDTGAAPSASPPDASAAPASVTADDTVAKVTRIWDALAGDSSSSTPAPPPSPAQAATAPDGTPAAVPPVPATDKGPIPFSDHQRVVNTTRTKTRTAILDEYGIGTAAPKDVQTGVTLVRLLQDNPALVLQVLQAQLGTQTPPAAPAAPADPEPEPDIELTDGRHVMSAERQRAWMAWHGRQVKHEIAKDYGPVRDAHDLAEITRLGHAQAQTAVASASQEWPLFDRLRTHIVEQIKALPDDRPLTADTFFRVYQQVYTAHAPALMRADLERERASDVALKTRGSSARPSAAQPVTPRTGKLTTRDRVAQIWDRLETAGAR